jgi:hypothetical protein
MAFNRNSGNHAFDINDKCEKCGMTRKDYEDRGEPRCSGQKPKEPESLPIPK